MTDDGLRLGFTARRWIAPGDEVTVDIAAGAVVVRDEPSGPEPPRVLRRIRDELEAGADGSDDPVEAARLRTAAGGLTLVLSWLEPARPGRDEEPGDGADVGRGGGGDAAASPPPAPTPGHVEPPTAPDPDAPPVASDDPARTGRPRSMPADDQDSTCERCGKPVPPEEAGKSWTRWRKVLCMNLAAGKPAADSCFVLHGKDDAAKRPPKTKPKEPVPVPAPAADEEEA